MPMKSEREYRDLTKCLEVRADQNSEDKEMKVEGYASTFDDKYCLYKGKNFEIWEQIDKNAFDNCDMSDVIFQYNHEGRVFARQSNGTLEVKTDDKGLFVSADLGKTEIGRQLYEEIRDGYTNKMSFGFRVDESRWEYIEDSEAMSVVQIRTITKIGKLYDVSAVSIPANDHTSISSRELSEGVIAEAEEEFQKRQEIKIKKRKLLLKEKFSERM